MYTRFKPGVLDPDIKAVVKLNTWEDYNVVESKAAEMIDGRQRARVSFKNRATSDLVSSKLTSSGLRTILTGESE